MVFFLLLLASFAFPSNFIYFKDSSYKEMLSYMERARVVYLGEIHDRKDVHELQLRVLRDLYRRGHHLILLMESFQQPFQDALDEYVNCEIDEKEMLARTEYMIRWRFDPQLYAPLWRFAKKHNIKLIALNVPTELIKEVRKKKLEDVKSRYIPSKIMPFHDKHKEFLRKVLEGHRSSDEERFFRVQLLWDMGMAYKVAKTALAFPDHKLVVIVGSGHVKRGYGIPERVNFLMGKISQAVIWVEGDRVYFLFSKDFSKESSSTNSKSEPN